VQQLEMMLEYNRNQAQLAAQYGQREAGRAYFDEARRIADELPYASLDQEIASFPLFQNPRCMLGAYSVITGQTVYAERRADGAWTLYVEQGNEAQVLRDRMTDQQLLDLVRSVNR